MSNIPASVAIEARAKMIWGEPASNVMTFLQEKGIGDKDALALLDELVAERSQEIRRDGFQKFWIGMLLAAVPLVYYFVSAAMGYMNLRFFSGLIVLGAIGLWRVARGLSMILRPASVTGDLSNISS